MRKISVPFKAAFSILELSSVHKNGFLQSATPTENEKAIEKDLPRECFVSSTGNLELFYGWWRQAASQKNYSYIQADMCGSAIPAIFYTIIFIPQLLKDPDFQKAHQDPERAANESGRSRRLGYFNDSSEMCGIYCVYNTYNPAQWILSILENATAPFEKRRITIYINGMTFNQSLASSSSSVDEFLMSLRSQSIAQLLAPLIDKKTHSINVEFANLLSLEYEMITPAVCTRPETVMAAYQKSMGSEMLDRKKRVTFQNPENQEPTQVIDVNLDYMLSYSDIQTIWIARFDILKKWLTEEDLLKDQPIPDVFLIDKEVSPFIESELPNRPGITLIPLYFGSHWNLLALLINSKNQIVSADYFYSYKNEAPAVLDRESFIAGEVQKVDPSFTGKVHCHLHLHSENLSATGTLVIEEAIFYVKMVLRLVKKLDPISCEDNEIATLLAYHIRAIGVDHPLNKRQWENVKEIPATIKNSSQHNILFDNPDKPSHCRSAARLRDPEKPCFSP